MNKQVYIHTAFTILSAKKFVEPLALSLDFNKYDVELWIDPFEGYFNNKAIFGLPVKYVDMHLEMGINAMSDIDEKGEEIKHFGY